jgi:hypothetical protein
MADDSNNPDPPKEEELKVMSSSGPKKSFESIIQELEVLALNKSTKGLLSMHDFDKEQKDKLLEVVKQNENNAYQYHTKS